LGDKRGLVSSFVLVLGVFAVLLIVGASVQSSPSADIVEAGEKPTTTTTTEPPPEGFVIVEVKNGSFKPANLTLDINEVWIVRWINRDPRDIDLSAADGMFETILVANGGEFEWDYSELPPAIYRYNGELGLARFPGIVDTRPEQ